MHDTAYSFNSESIMVNKSINMEYSSVSEVTILTTFFSNSTPLSSASAKNSCMFMVCSGLVSILISGGFSITVIIDSIILGIKSVQFFFT